MFYLVAGSLLFGSALIGLLATAAGNTAFFASHIQLLLWVTIGAGIGLALLIAYQAYLLVRRIRAGVFGAKLTARLFLIIGVMSLAPGLVVYGVSVQFLIRSIESWFDVRMENALEGGLALGQSALDHVQQETAKKTERLALQLSDLPPVLQVARLDDLREAAGVQELGLFDDNGALLGFSSSERRSMLPSPPERASLWQARLQKTWSRLQETHGGGIAVRVVVPVNMASLSDRPRVVQVLQPVPRQLAQDAQQVEEARQGYQELLLSRLGLKRLYGISLTLALALALFSAFSLAFLLSERLAAPLRALARGTRAVARGDFTEVQTVSSRDELGMLTHSFNRMTRQLSEARVATEESRDQLLEANAYLEGVLASVTTGVVTLEHNLVVRVVNPAAAALLGISRTQLEGRALTDLGVDSLAGFAEDMARHFHDSPTRSWREQIELLMPTGKRVLLARGTPLTSGETPDYVLALDDVTQLLQAQRNAAWGEVARRMAHEIKNPLTPIQLSAERLEAKLADKLEGAARETLLRATATIVGQVGAMKGLVDAFAQYARLPSPRIERLDLNVLVMEVLHLYEGGIPITSELAEHLPAVAGDPALLGQVLVNLVKNAQEALEGTESPRIVVATSLHGTQVSLCVQDSGPGFPAELLDRLFEPYVTSKPKGTGLGLPVVQKIVEEHHGSVVVENPETGGARICVRLPALLESGESPRASSDSPPAH